MRMRDQRRGIALGLVVITAFIFAIAAFAVLTMAISSAQRSGESEDRLRAQFAAEAGLVWAMQKLFVDAADPSFCGGGVNMPFDTDGDGTNETTVNIKASSCNATDNRTLEARVVY